MAGTTKPKNDDEVPASSPKEPPHKAPPAPKPSAAEPAPAESGSPPPAPTLSAAEALLRGIVPRVLDPNAHEDVAPANQTPDPVLVAAGQQSAPGATRVKLYDGPGHDAAEVNPSSMFSSPGDGTVVRAATEVWEEYVPANANTAIRRLLYPASTLVPVATAEAVKKAVLQARER
jgi:hypothetical protein